MLARLRPRLFGALLKPLVCPRPLARALSERIQPRPWTSERRKGRGGEWCTEAVFRMRHRGRLAWDDAEVERRRDGDGRLYTLAEFRAYYASGDGGGGGASSGGGGGSSDGGLHGAGAAEAEVAERWSRAKHWDRHMTSAIKQESDTGRLLGLHADLHHAWNAVHLNALWHRLGQLDRGRAGLHRRDAELEVLLTTTYTSLLIPYY